MGVRWIILASNKSLKKLEYLLLKNMLSESKKQIVGIFIFKDSRYEVDKKSIITIDDEAIWSLQVSPWNLYEDNFLISYKSSFKISSLS